VWAFAYNPTHFAGLQVFFQALFNKNALVFVFQRDFKKVYKDLEEHQVSNMSCTPTFMKLLLGSIENPLEQVKVLTFGGERFDPKIMEGVSKYFPNAKISNVYASTEAGSLLRGQGEYFSIPDRYKDLIRIENDELLIHHDLLGESKTFALHGNWYHTGDKVEYIDETRFKFKNRDSDLINVGGYKINPIEIEGVISKISGVSDVLVMGRKNSLLGNVIVAEIISDGSLTEPEIKKLIKDEVGHQLQSYKMPHKIKFVKSFQLTRTGKVKRT
ncbi:MAG: AMP-binding protein, partial [Eudoraea sp.]|nr:AMP-binding protein [Eudoraea sp.]